MGFATTAKSSGTNGRPFLEENFYLLAEAVILQAKADYIKWHDRYPRLFGILRAQLLNESFTLYLPSGVRGEQVITAFEDAYQKSRGGGVKRGYETIRVK